MEIMGVKKKKKIEFHNGCLKPVHVGVFLCVSEKEKTDR